MANNSDPSELPLSGDGEPFATHLVRLTIFLTQQISHAKWSRAEVVEVDMSEGRPHPDRPRIPAEMFEARWSEIIRSVDRPWINVSACGVDQGVLVVAVEWVGGPPSRRLAPIPRVSVNLSGAAGEYRWAWA